MTGGKRIARLVEDVDRLIGDGRFEEALATLAEVCELKRGIRGGGVDYAVCLTSLALLHRSLGDEASALPRFRSASEVLAGELGDRDQYYWSSLENLAESHESLGDFVEAEKVYLRLLAFRRDGLGERHPDYVQALTGLAGLYRKVGRFATAQRLYEDLVRIRRQAPGEWDPDDIRRVNNLAYLHVCTGEYSRAEPLYREVLERIAGTSGRGHLDYAVALNNLAMLREQMGDRAEAERLLSEALDIKQRNLGPDNPSCAGILNNLAILREADGDLDAAESLHKKALRIRRAAGDGYRRDSAETLGNLASVYGSRHDYRRAVKTSQKALDLLREAVGTHHPDYATGLNNLAWGLSRIGAHSESEKLFRKVVRLRRKLLGEDHPDYASALENLAWVSAATGRPRLALRYLWDASAIRDRSADEIFSIGSDRQRGIHAADLRRELNIFLSLVRAVDAPRVRRRALQLVWRRKGIVLQAAMEQQEALLSGRYPALRDQLHDLTTLRSQIATRTLDGPGSEGPEAHGAILQEWRRRCEELERTLAMAIPEVRLSAEWRSVTVKEVVRRLPGSSALVELVMYDRCDPAAILAPGEQARSTHYLAFILTAGKPQRVRLADLGPAQEIDQMLARWRLSIASAAGRDLGEYEAPSGGCHVAAAALRAAVLDPILRRTGRVKTLFVAPDGDLTRLPYQALAGDDGRYAIDDYTICYLSTGRDLIRKRPTVERPPDTPVVVAAPDFDLRQAEPRVARSGDGTRDPRLGGLSFSPLSGLRREGRTVADLLGTRPLMGPKAMESTVKSVRSPHVLHIATHGFFLPDKQRRPGEPGPDLASTAPGPLTPARFLGAASENPLLRSGLALAGANRRLRGEPLPAEAEDGILNAQDVTTLDLLDTALVVLSACDTGLGEIQRGEGVFGLRRAFALAGARTLVMSLWKVPDAETADLMEQFYRLTLGGLPCVEALRQAQLLIRQRQSQQRAGPFAWGAFICAGDPDPFGSRPPAG
jgi:CHAT domain-containing protein/tetratricopeptide (TPR) repeat protein